VPEVPLDGGPIQAALASSGAEDIGRLLHNRLQKSAEQLRPELTAWLARLAATKPAGCLLSGSGSTMFALARDGRDARRIAEAIAADASAARMRTCVVRSLV
jgi:4-diphosphocytidyl-2-C-methyl-D-erythritol kinase